MSFAPEEEIQGHPVQFLYQNSLPVFCVSLQVAGVPPGFLIAVVI